MGQSLRVFMKVFLESADGGGLGCQFLFQLSSLLTFLFLCRHGTDTQGTILVFHHNGAADGKAKLLQPSAFQLDLRYLGVGAASASALVCDFDVFLLRAITSCLIL